MGINCESVSGIMQQEQMIKKNGVQRKELEITLGFKGKFSRMQNLSKCTTFRLVLCTNGCLINPAQY